MGDPLRLQQILINLIGNAVKFTELGGVSLLVRGGEFKEPGRELLDKIELHFEIEDSGPGIEESDLEKIFDSFTQAKFVVKKKFGGTGLGLAISKKLVHEIGGDISVTSTPNKGSTFKFNGWFEISNSTEDLPEKDMVHRKSEGELPALSAPLNILLVEDSPDNRFLFEAFLKQLDCSLDIAENGKVALEKSKTSTYDLILMDIQMPVMDGYSATRLIRSHEKKNNKSRTPIIALSAHAKTEEQEKSLKAGCNMHLSKPVNKKSLLAAIYSQLPKQSQNNQYQATKIPEITVHIDKMIEDLIPGFLKNRRNDIEKLQKAVQDGDMNTIKMLGHMLKGMGGGYGFEKISELGKSIELAARQSNSGIILSLTKELETYLDNIKVVFVD
jgi:CheY-like chemotaxis protein